jgi:pimeloyl-ACP methyl ester carboxylesterase
MSAVSGGGTALLITLLPPTVLLRADRPGGLCLLPDRKSTMHPTIRTFLLAAGSLAACACGSPNGSSADAEADSTHSASPDVRVSNDGVFIDHRSCGHGDTTLLFVHGWAIDQGYWSEQVAAFCPDHRVVTMDLPGHGNSGKNRESWAVEDYASDVRAVLDQLDLSDVVLIGHSMGGDIILEAAIDNDRVIALVGVDNFKDVGAEYTEEVRAWIAGFIDELRTDFDSAAVAYSRRALFQPTTDSAVVHRVIQSELAMDPAIAATTLEKLFEYAPGEADRLSRLDKPLHLINSSATPTDSAGLRSTGVPFRVLDVGPTGHYPMIEDAKTFNGLLRQALEEIRTR